jgi:hypothetical protein
MIVRYEWFAEDIRAGLRTHTENNDYFVVQSVHGLQLIDVLTARVIHAPVSEDIANFLNSNKCAPGWVNS